jgi:aspartate 1-decarboxylase
MRRFLHAKIHRATITEADIDYEGSIALPPSLLSASGICAHEAVWVWDITNGARFETYVISGVDAPALDSTASICINGAAARLVNKGDLIIIAAFCFLDPSAIADHQPRVVFVDHMNHLKYIGQEQAFKS